jgi:hypothetical protein
MASPTVPHNPQAPAGIGGGQVIVIRPHRADLVNNHAVVRVVPLPGGSVALNTVIRAIGDSRWASESGTTATLYAGLLQRPGTTLRVDGPIHTLRLADSATSPAYLAGSRSTVIVTGVTVVSVTGSGHAAHPAAESPHRPYVRYAHATVTATGSSFQALGSRDTPGRSGVDIGAGSMLTASNTAFTGSGIGLTVDSASRAVLTGVTATGNSGAGIELNRVNVADLTAVTTSGNATGLVLRGPLGSLGMQQVTARQNAIGLDAAGLSAGPDGTDVMALGPVATDHNTVAGVALTNCPGCLLRGVTSANDDVGIRLSGRSTGAGVQDSTVSTTGTGVEVNTANASVERVNVSDASVGVQVGAGAAGATVTAVATSGAGTGLDIDSDAGTVTVTGFSSRQEGGTGIRSGAAHVTITNPTVSGAVVGLDLKGGVGVNGGLVTDAAEAVRIGAGGHVQFTGVNLQAHVLGLRVASTGHVTLLQSTVKAPLGARGRVHIGKGTTFPALPLRWLGVLALVALAIAAFLETLRRLRERSHDRSVTAPSHILNTT